MNILAIGDVCGESGVHALERNLSALKGKYNADFTVVNGENADVVGITPQLADRLFKAGADVITLGNHTWSRRQIVSYIEEERALLRPENLSPVAPGEGCGIFDGAGKRILVVNLIGRCNMLFGPDNPFYCIDRILTQYEGKFDIALVDFHAEATSEKIAMAYHLDGRVSALWGTHTHVQTADERVFQNGTGYITDLGMTGPRDSVIGARPEQSLALFLGKVPIRFQSAEGVAMINGACFNIAKNGACESVTRINCAAEG